MIADMVPPWGTKVHYMSGIHTNVTTVQLPSGQARYSYLRDKLQNVEMTPFMCIDTVCGSLKESGIGLTSVIGDISTVTVSESTKERVPFTISTILRGEIGASGNGFAGWPTSSYRSTAIT